MRSDRIYLSREIKKFDFVTATPQTLKVTVSEINLPHISSESFDLIFYFIPLETGFSVFSQDSYSLVSTIR